jgi:hypothetical protein
MTVVIGILVVWCMALTVFLLALARQVGLMAVRVNLVPANRPTERLHLNEPIAPAVLEKLQNLGNYDDEETERYVMWFSAECMTCRRATASFRDKGHEDRMRSVVRECVALISGAGDAVAQMQKDLVTAGCRTVVADPEARNLAEALHLPGTPIALAYKQGYVTGWTDADDAERLADLHRSNSRHERDTGDASSTIASLAED